LSQDEPPEAEFAPAFAAHAASAEWQTLFHPLLLPPPPSHSSLQLTLFHKLHILPSAPPAVSTIPLKLSQNLVKPNSQLQPKLQQQKIPQQSSSRSSQIGTNPSLTITNRILPFLLPRRQFQTAKP
jgi:hypothetical protein